MAAYTEPALSSVSVNRYKMGSKAMDLIFERINQDNDKENSNTSQPSTSSSYSSNYINTGFDLVQRKSTR
jgi:LacI family gluconate utilization system Gnt-I transcriptional repressor